MHVCRYNGWKVKIYVVCMKILYVVGFNVFMYVDTIVSRLQCMYVDTIGSRLLCTYVCM